MDHARYPKKKGTRHSRSKFLLLVSVIFVACFVMILAAFLSCLSMLNRMEDRLQNVLVASLNNEIDSFSTENAFSGTLYNISDELVNDDTLAQLGQRASMADDDLLAKAEDMLDDVLTRTAETKASRYFYFSNSDYLIDANLRNENARGGEPEQVERILDELQTANDRITGTYENHIGTDNGAGFQLMVRTVAPGAYYVVYFPSSTLIQEVPEGFTAFDNVQMFYYDQFGSSIACRDLQTLSGRYTYESLGDGDTGVVYCKQDGENYMGVYCTSHSRNIRLAVFFSDDIANARELATRLFFVAALLAFIGFLVALVSIDRIYKPVDSLAKSLAQQKHEAEGQSTEDEHAVPKGKRGTKTTDPFFRDDGAIIADTIDSYQTALERQRKLLSSVWLSHLLFGASPDTLNEYEDSWISNLQGSLYTVVVIRSDAPADTPGDASGSSSNASDGAPEEERALFRSAWKQTVEQDLSDGFECRFADIADEEAAIISLIGTSEEDLIAYLKQMQDKHEELEFSVFIGTPRTRVEEISPCFHEAIDTAEYCMAQELYDVVVRYSDIRDIEDERNACMASLGELPQLARDISSHDMDRAMKTFDEIVHLADAENQSMSTDQGETYLTLLKTSMVLMLESLPARQDADLRATIDANAEKIRSAKNTTQVRKQLAAIMRYLASAEEKQSSRELFERIRADVQKNFRDANLSSGAIARRMGISQSWVTQLFRQYNKTTFLEYLHGLRLSEAATLLRTTDLTEEVIARRVGYGNTITMIRAFKKYQGITPSSLRRRPEDDGV